MQSQNNKKRSLSRKKTSEKEKDFYILLFKPIPDPGHSLIFHLVSLLSLWNDTRIKHTPAFNEIHLLSSSIEAVVKLRHQLIQETLQVHMLLFILSWISVSWQRGRKTEVFIARWSTTWVYLMREVLNACRILRFSIWHLIWSHSLLTGVTGRSEIYTRSAVHITGQIQSKSQYNQRERQVHNKEMLHTKISFLLLPNQFLPWQ